MSEPAQRLFVVMLGGRHPGAHVELHDVVFALGASLQDTCDQLRGQWFGEQAGLHIDSWLEVDGVEGWQVRLADAPAPEGSPRLFFVNLGGYQAGVFGEAHGYVLVVAADAVEAKAKGKALAGADWNTPHKDALLEVDDCLPVATVAGRHIQLIAGAHAGIGQHSGYLLLA